MVNTNSSWGPLAVIGGIIFVMLAVTVAVFVLGLAGGAVGYAVAFVLNELFGWGLPYSEAVMVGTIVGILGGGSSYDRGD